jgi:phosphoribosylanthranilate isomerase
MGYHVRVKVCGLTCPGDLHAAARLGADAVGLNFHPPSPRSLTPERAAGLLAAWPPFVEAVGVFVRQTVHEVRPLLERLGRVRTVQIHGGPHAPADGGPYHLVPAFAVRDEDDRRAIDRYLEACRAAGRLPAAVLVDGHAPGLHGGTGQVAPWRLLAGWRPGVPVVLAGGLTPDNVAEAVRVVRPWAVDVASGVEASPGRKDEERMRRFIDRAREAAWALPLDAGAPTPDYYYGGGQSGP